MRRPGDRWHGRDKRHLGETDVESVSRIPQISVTIAAISADRTQGFTPVTPEGENGAEGGHARQNEAQAVFEQLHGDGELIAEYLAKEKRRNGPQRAAELRAELMILWRRRRWRETNERNAHAT